MDYSFLYISLLAIIQGITEFIPVSSSAHLVLLPHIFNVEDQGLAVDVALHAGSLLAVALALHKENLAMVKDALEYLFHPKQHKKPTLLFHLLIATLPIVIVGFIAKSLVEDNLRNPLYLGISSIMFAAFLFIADRNHKRNRTLADLTPRHALFIGLLQIFALIPGASRSGTSITAGRFLGLSTVDATKFSILLGIPIIFAAMTLIAFSAFQNPVSNEELYRIAIASALSFTFSYLTIKIMLRWLKKSTFTPFVVYRILLGIVLIVLYF